MRIAALQWDVRRADVAGNLAAARAGLERAREAGVELVLLPEMWASSFPDAGDDVPALVRAARAACQELAECGARLEVDWAGSGFAPSERVGELARPTNRLELFVRGELKFAYDKLHLFGPTAEDSVFSGGSKLPATLDWRGTRVSGVICWELLSCQLSFVIPFLKTLVGRSKSHQQVLPLARRRLDTPDPRQPS